jgi:hypothetical protein
MYTKAEAKLYNDYLARMNALNAGPEAPETRHVGVTPVAEMSPIGTAETKRIIQLMAEGERLLDLVFPDAHGNKLQRWQLSPSGALVPQPLAESLIKDGIMQPVSTGVYQHRNCLGKQSVGEKRAQAVTEMEQRQHTQKLIAEMKKQDELATPPAAKSNHGWDSAKGRYTDEAVQAARMGLYNKRR